MPVYSSISNLGVPPVATGAPVGRHTESAKPLSTNPVGSTNPTASQDPPSPQGAPDAASPQVRTRTSGAVVRKQRMDELYALRTQMANTSLALGVLAGQVKNLTDANSTKENYIAHLLEQNSMLWGRASNSELTLASTKEHVRWHEDQARSLTTAYAALKTEAQATASQLAAKNRDIEARDARIAALEAQLAALAIQAVSSAEAITLSPPATAASSAAETRLEAATRRRSTTSWPSVTLHLTKTSASP